MALWLNRAGKHGQDERKFLDENRIFLTWTGLKADLGKLKSRKEVGPLLREFFPNAPKGKIVQNTGQIWAFAAKMKPGDLVVLPSKMKRVIHVGEITGPYRFEPSAEDPYFHYRDVKWIATDVPRSNFDQDILYSFGAFLTICSVRRNDAERRVREMAKSGWKAPGAGSEPKSGVSEGEDEEPTEEVVDLELLARDRIAKFLIGKLKGHGMAMLVEAILKAQGYTTFRSPEGPDKGVDILAAPGPLGFGRPRIAVQVKSGDSPIDRPTLDQLLGTMQNVQADQGLLVSWGGFKTSIDRETASHFFRVRLWDQDDLINQLLENYANLTEDLRAELPLKRIWTVAAQEEEE